VLRLLIVRHGQTDWNLEGRSQGHTDIELNDRGRCEVQSLAVSLENEPIDIIYSSDLSRAASTVKALAESRRIRLILTKALRERSYGTWEGKTEAEVLSFDEIARRAYHDNPTLLPSGGSETGIDVFMRATRFLTEVIAEHSSGTVLIATHGAMGCALISVLLGGTPTTADCMRLDNSSVTEVQISERGRRRLIRYNDIVHLDNCPTA
jgi:broad specificity phosphatase PhoE